MKLKYFSILTILVLLLAACGSNDGESLADFVPIERDSESESAQSDNEETTVDNDESVADSAIQDDTEDGSNPNSEEGAEDEPVEEVGEEKDEEAESDEETETDESIEEVEEASYYNNQALDLTEPEDESAYTTGLVFIVEENDLWRVVDRTGKVFRVSSSYDNANPGIVNNNANVEIDEDGNPSVSLVRDYTDYDDKLILETSKDNAAQVFAIELLEEGLNISSGNQLEAYEIKEVTVSETIGKGIVVGSVVFDAVPAKDNSSWGVEAQSTVSNVEYSFTLYGYDNTWILPVREPLYVSVGSQETVAEENTSETESSKEESDSELDDESMVENSETEENDEEVHDSEGLDEDSSLEENDETDNSGFIQSVDIMAYGNKKLVIEKELLPQSELLQGTSVYEHEGRLVIVEGDSTKLIHDGETNQVYELITVHNGKAYIFTKVTPPSSEILYTGVIVVDMETESYRTLYNGAVSEGMVSGENYYVFGNDNIFEVDLVNNSLRIVTTLPMHLEFGTDQAVVESVSDGVLTVFITHNGLSTNYAVDISTGTMTEQ